MSKTLIIFEISKDIDPAEFVILAGPYNKNSLSETAMLDRAIQQLEDIPYRISEDEVYPTFLWLWRSTRGAILEPKRIERFEQPTTNTTTT